jgi:hypothetical protein
MKFFKFISLLALVIIFMVSRYACLLIACAVLPSISVVYLERKLTLYAISVICSFNITALAPFLFTLYRSQDINMGAKMMVGDPYTWLIIYGSSAFGWLMILYVPHIVANIFVSMTCNQIRALEEKQQKLVEMWGEEVRDGK